MLEMTMRQAGIGDSIRKARKDKHWKQKHLAAAVHVEPVTVSRWERGVSTPDLDTLQVIARETGKPISFFVADESDLQTEASLAETAQQLAAELARLTDLNDRLEARLAEQERPRRSRKRASST
jgi:transcriptional regulator with XRE-family HTH domain